MVPIRPRVLTLAAFLVDIVGTTMDMNSTYATVAIVVTSPPTAPFLECHCLYGYVGLVRHWEGEQLCARRRITYEKMVILPLIRTEPVRTGFRNMKAGFEILSKALGFI